MNFLAHLHLASLADSSLLGNLLADFVRGTPGNEFSPEIISGIYMHRRVDSLTDNLPEVAIARQWFRPETRRVAPISLDIIWDHFLARHWQDVNPTQPLANFVAHARDEITPQLAATPAAFIDLNSHLWEERWMERYRDMPFIARVLNGMATRRPKLSALRESWVDLEKHYPALEDLFWSFYPRMMTSARRGELTVHPDTK